MVCLSVELVIGSKMKLKEFDRPKSTPLDLVWTGRDLTGIREMTTITFKVVCLERERRALEKRLGYAVNDAQLSSIFRAILTGEVGLKEL